MPKSRKIIEYQAGQRNSDQKIDLNRQVELSRKFNIEDDWINEKERTITVPVSSEYRVKRWFSDEILGHDSENVDLQRTKDVGSFLFAHGRDPNYGMVPLGPVMETWLDEATRQVKQVLKFDKSKESERLWQKVKDKSLKGISVSYLVKKWRRIDEEETYKGFEGPAYYAEKWEITETSLEPTPADPSVGGRTLNDEEDEGEVLTKEQKSEIRQMCRSVGMESLVDGLIQRASSVEEARKELLSKLAESRNIETPEQKTDEPAQGQRKTGEEPVNVDAERKAAIEGERKRTADITGMCRKFDMEPTFEEDLIKRGVSVENARKAVMDKLSESRGAANLGIQVGETSREKQRAAMQDSLYMRAGITIEKPADGTRDFRGLSLMEMARKVCAVNDVDIRGLEKLDVIQRAMSTSDFPLILANVANKTLVRAYEEAPTTFQLWTRKGNATDFKEMKRLQMSAASGLKKIKEGGKYEHAGFTESKETIKVETYGRTTTLTRQMIINDDLSAFDRIPRLFGAGAKRTINEAVYEILTSNPAMGDGKTLFHADHKNLAGTGSTLNGDSLKAGKLAMRTQKDIGNKATLNILPKYLLIPGALEVAAMQLLQSLGDPAAAHAGVKNIWNGSLNPIVEPLLDAASATAHYLIADNSQIDTVEVAYLDGNETPHTERRVNWETDGIEFKIRHDFGVKALDHRGMYQNPGV